MSYLHQISTKDREASLILFLPDFPYPNHVVRADHPAAHYQQSPSGRLSVVVPLDLQQSSPDYVLILLRFMCLGSCVGGISRRPISIVITLENGCVCLCVGGGILAYVCIEYAHTYK